MKTKPLLAVLATGLTLLSTVALSADFEKGEITTLDVSKGRISIDTTDMTIGSDTRVANAKGHYKSHSDLKIDQEVHYTVNENNFITEIRIFPDSVQEQRKLGYDDEVGND